MRETLTLLLAFISKTKLLDTLLDIVTDMQIVIAHLKSQLLTTLLQLERVYQRDKLGQFTSTTAEKLKGATARRDIINKNRGLDSDAQEQAARILRSPGQSSAKEQVKNRLSEGRAVFQETTDKLYEALKSGDYDLQVRALAQSTQLKESPIPIMAAIAFSQKAIANATGDDQPLNTLLDDFGETLFEPQDKMMWREILRELS